MRVLLIATNRAERYMDRMVVRPLPIGVAYLAAYLDAERHRLEVLDLMFSQRPMDDVGEAVTRFRPDLVGLSIRNLDNQSYLNPVWHLPEIKEIVGRVRSLSDAVLVCGGPAFSILPEPCLDFVTGDLGIAGDAGESFAELVDRLDAGLDYNDIPGIVFRDGDSIASRPARFSEGFTKAPRLDLLDLRRYDKAGFGLGVVTKLAGYYYPTADGRGAYGGDDWRARPVEDVVEEVQRLSGESGVRKLFFIDSAFNVPLDHAKSLCRALAASDLRLRWNTYLRPGECDGELIELMKESGCSLALVSGASTGRDLSADLGSVRTVASLCRKGDLPYTLSLSFGDPGETNATVEAKLDMLKEVEPSFATLRLGTRILPGTDVAATALEDGLIKSEADLIEPVFYIAPELRGGLADRLRSEASAHPRWNLM